MGRIHPSKVIAAVKSLATAGANAHKIQAMLAAGEVPGIDAYEMPLRTVQEHAQNAKRDLDPLPEDDLDAVNAIERMGLRVAMEEAKRLRAKQRKSGLSKAELGQFEAAIKLGQAIRADRRRRPASDADQAKGQKLNDAATAAPASILDTIAAELGREPAPNDASAHTPASAHAPTREDARGTGDDNGRRPAPDPAHEGSDVSSGEASNEAANDEGASVHRARTNDGVNGSSSTQEAEAERENLA